MGTFRGADGLAVTLGGDLRSSGFGVEPGRRAAAIAIAATIGLAVPAKFVRHWLGVRGATPNSDPGSQFVARAEALAASLPLEPVEFLSDALDSGERGRRFCLVQHALAPRMLEDHGPEGSPSTCRRFAVASLLDPSKVNEMATTRGMRILANGGDGLFLLSACP